MKLFSLLKVVLVKQWMILIPMLLFGLLLLRNPYSQRTVIGNLEPYPDSIHYLNPALSLIHGQGLFITREGRKLLPGVPPLYSLTLIPGFLLNQDVRTFYLTNVVLAFSAFGLFYLILSQFKLRKFYIFLLLCLYATNFTLYWFPELAMAESLILPLFLGALYLLLLPISRRHAVIVSFLAVAFFATKFASLPLSIALPFIYFVKVGISRSHHRLWIYIYFLLSLLAFAGVYVGYDTLVRGGGLISGLFSLFWTLFAPKHVLSSVKGGSQSGGFFSLQYVGQNLSAYGNWLIGKPMYILWRNISILPKYLALVGWLGLFGTLFTKFRGFGLSIMLFVVSNFFFMMTFYAADGRYFIIAIPILLLNLGLCFSFIKTNLSGKLKQVANLILIVLCLAYLVSQVSRIKYDVLLNLRHTESPWYLISVQTFDSYLKVHSNEFMAEPVVISALPPYVVDFYARQKFILLPLSPDQEFKTHRVEAWGNVDFEHLLSVYEQYFRAGHPVFLTGYGLGNEQYLHTAFDHLQSQFVFQKVQDGCFSLCNIYEMKNVVPPLPLAAKTPKLN